MFDISPCRCCSRGRPLSFW